MRQTDAVRLGDETEQMPVTVEAPRAAMFDDLQAWLVMAIKQLVGNAARRSLIGQLQRLGAKPLYTDDRDDLLRQNSPDCGGWLEIFEAGHVDLRVVFSVRLRLFPLFPVSSAAYLSEASRTTQAKDTF